jgi:hypothetical protein
LQYIKMNTFQGYSHSKSNFGQKSTHPTAQSVQRSKCELYDKKKSTHPTVHSVCSVQLVNFMIKKAVKSKTSSGQLANFPIGNIVCLVGVTYNMASLNFRYRFFNCC